MLARGTALLLCAAPRASLSSVSLILPDIFLNLVQLLLKGGEDTWIAVVEKLAVLLLLLQRLSFDRVLA